MDDKLTDKEETEENLDTYYKSERFWSFDTPRINNINMCSYAENQKVF